MKHIEGECGEVVFASLSGGEDLITSIAKVSEERDISAGAFFAIGTLSQVTFSYYYPKIRPATLKKPLEMVGCSGSISRTEHGGLQVHGHIEVADSKFKSYGGHLLKGTIVGFMVFVAIFEVKGADLSGILPPPPPELCDLRYMFQELG